MQTNNMKQNQTDRLRSSNEICPNYLRTDEKNIEIDNSVCLNERRVNHMKNTKQKL